MLFKKKNNNPPKRIYIVDETDLSVVLSKVPHDIALKGKEPIGSLNSAERGFLVSLIPCISGRVDFVPLLLIFLSKNINEQLLRGAP